MEVEGQGLDLCVVRLDCLVGLLFLLVDRLLKLDNGLAKLKMFRLERVQLFLALVESFDQSLVVWLQRLVGGRKPVDFIGRLIQLSLKSVYISPYWTQLSLLFGCCCLYILTILFLIFQLQQQCLTSIGQRIPIRLNIPDHIQLQF